MYDIIIVGGGPAGLVAAVYARRAGKRVLVMEKATFGGQITYSPKVENIPGTRVISGTEFADNFVSQALDLGADDYLVKPFEMPELLARVQAVLRRTKRDESFMRIDNLLIDFESRKAFLDGKYNLNIPLSIARNTYVDALCHLIEGYTNKKSTPDTDMVAAADLH